MATYNGLNVVVSNNLPRDVISHDIFPIYAHWFIRPFLRFFGSNEIVGWRGEPVYGNYQSLVMNGTLFVHPQMFCELQREAGFLSMPPKINRMSGKPDFWPETRSAKPRPQDDRPVTISSIMQQVQAADLAKKVDQSVLDHLNGALGKRINQDSIFKEFFS